MNVLVTGGSGWIGRYVVRDLIGNGHEVLSADLSPPLSGLQREMASATRYRADFRHLTIDMTDAGQVYQALSSARADAVVHLAAWPDPGIVPDAKTYSDNTTGTFNILQACKDRGVEHVVSASSSQVYGFARYAPAFVAVDESHPVRPLNCYAASKIAGEKAAAYFCDQYGLRVFSFRFQGVRLPEDLDRDINTIATRPADGALTLWTRVDVRDAATACRLTIESERACPGVYNITGSRVVLDTATRELIGQFYGAETEVRQMPDGYGSPMSCQKAESEFGFRPRFIWSESQRHLD